MLISPAAPYPRVVADIGGSALRFGWVEAPGAAVAHVASQTADACSGVESALARYLEGRGRASPRAGRDSASRGRCAGDIVTMTNRDWTFSIEELRHRLGLERLVVLNDFAALAWGLPTLTRPASGARSERARPSPVRRLGCSARARAWASRLLLATGAGFVAVAGEGGHVSLAASSLLEEQTRRYAAASRRPRLRRARAVGPGHRSSLRCALRARRAGGRTAHAGRDHRAGPAGKRRMLPPGPGPVLQLSSAAWPATWHSRSGARGGIYIAGGIVARLGDEIDRSAFRERFVAKGRFRPFLSGIATWVITNASTLALRGANASLGS